MLLVRLSIGVRLWSAHTCICTTLAVAVVCVAFKAALSVESLQLGSICRCSNALLHISPGGRRGLDFGKAIVTPSFGAFKGVQVSRCIPEEVSSCLQTSSTVKGSVTQVELTVNIAVRDWCYSTYIWSS